MILIFEAILAAAIGAVIIALVVILRFYTAIPVSRVTGGRIYSVISAEGTAPELEACVDSLRWLIKTGRINCSIMIIDCGMTDEARLAAEIMAREDVFISVCTPEEALYILKKG